MKYLSVCSGIEAATMAWHHLGWNPIAFSEIEPFPSKVLAYHYPDTPNLGDMSKFKEWNIEQPDLLVGGTPCQSFSIAGLRKGLDDPRGNLMLTYLAIAKRYSPKWLVWENVPGVLSSNGGRDFATFLGGMAELGYGFAYRVLDAQFTRTDGYPYAVPQRRRRVFVVGYLGNWQRAAAVLLDSESLCGNPPPSRKARKEVTEVAGTLTSNCGGLNRPAGNANELDFCIAEDVAGTLTRRTGVSRNNHEECVAQTLLARNGGFDLESETPILQTCSGKNTYGTLTASQGQKLWLGNQEALSGDYHIFDSTVAFKIRGGCEGGGKGYLGSEESAFTLSTTHDQDIFTQMRVRRLTPRECERLQGFPDDFTNIPGATDTTRYKALGNSMAVNVMQVLGERIQMVEEINGR